MFGVAWFADKESDKGYLQGDHVTRDTKPVEANSQWKEIAEEMADDEDGWQCIYLA